MNKASKSVLLSGRQSGTLEQKTYDFLKKQIMDCVFKPGQVINDGLIAKELKISRTPVRSALRLLEHEGLLINNANRGWKVYSLTLEDIRDIFEIKLELESLIARQASKSKDSKKREEMKKALARMKKSAVDGDIDAWRKADMQLHDIIFSMCPNKRASHIIKNLNNQWYRVRIGMIAIKGRIDRSNIEHEDLVESILNGNADAADRQMRLHLRNVRDELEHVLINLVLPFAQNGI